MSDLNFNRIPSEIKYFIPGKETVNDISNLFGSLQKMKIPQVESDIDLEVVNSYTFISPDFVKSFISELLYTDRSRSLFDVNVMS
jgi:hypothetical protein